MFGLTVTSNQTPELKDCQKPVVRLDSNTFSQTNASNILSPTRPPVIGSVQTNYYLSTLSPVWSMYKQQKHNLDVWTSYPLK